MRTKAILLASVFILILLIPVSFATGTQNYTLENNMISTQTLGYSHSPSGATNSTTTSFPTSDSVTVVPSGTKNTDQSSTTPSPSPSGKAVKTWLIVILLVIMVLMVLVAYLHHVCQQSDHSGSVPRFLLDVRERLRTWIRNLEDHLGVQLWPGDKRTAEDAMEEDAMEDTEGGQADEGEVWRGGEGANNELSNEEKGEHKEEDSDTSDDCSSLEGDDLRERALNRQNEEEGNQSKDEDETSTSSDEGQSHSEGMSGGNKNEDSEETALVISPQQDLCDVTVL
ncbi:hypothetical protein ACER0C_030834 [Sarotherodon galilaeus]